MLKKIVSVILVIACIFSLAACGNTNSYEYGPVAGGASASDQVTNNGNYLVQKGNYIYFINSGESATATNSVASGNTAGSIVRANLDGSDATLIFPKLVTNTAKVGLFIFGDRIYFTSPCDEINSSGTVQSSYLDIMSVKLDGTGAQKYATLGASNYPMTFIEENGIVYFVYISNSKMYSINLSDKKPTSTVLLDKYVSYLFGENVIFYSMLANVEGSETINDRYSEVFALSPSGEKTKLFDGNSTSNIKYKYSLKKIDDGKLYYEKTDSVMTLEDSLCYREINGKSLGNETRVFTNFFSSFAKYQNGYVISDSTLGTVYVSSDFSKSVKLNSSSLAIAGINGNYLYYTTTESSVSKLFRIDIQKALSLKEDEKVESEQVLYLSTTKDDEGKETKTYDTMYATYFTNYTIIGNNMFYYSNGSEKTRYLYKWDIEKNVVSVVSYFKA